MLYDLTVMSFFGIIYCFLLIVGFALWDYMLSGHSHLTSNQSSYLFLSNFKATWFSKDMINEIGYCYFGGLKILLANVTKVHEVHCFQWMQLLKTGQKTDVTSIFEDIVRLIFTFLPLTLNCFIWISYLRHWPACYF